MEKILIVKIGSVLEQEDQLHEFLKAFSPFQDKKILVHGGGKKATEVATKMGLEPKMLDGRRITDSNMLSVAIMVYAGLLNKTIVAKCQQFGCNAIGLSGADGGVIKAHKRPVVNGIDYGLVGDIDEISADKMGNLLESGFIPVLNAITHDPIDGQLLNTNADTIATEVAIAMSVHYQVELIYLFDQVGVMKDLNNPDSLIAQMDLFSYQSLQEQGIIYSGMIPKLDNAFRSLRAGVHSVRITAVADFINNGIGGKLGGTLLKL